MSLSIGELVGYLRLDDSRFKSALKTSTTQFDKSGQSMEKRTGRIKSLLVGLGAGAALAGLFKIGKSLEAAGERAGTSDARLQQVAKSMGLFGGQSDVVASRLSKLAEQQARNTGLDQNTIKLTQAKLLTFSNLAKTADRSGGAFDRASQAAQDMAAAGFGTADQNAVQLGKALQDPIKGISALARSGITFSEKQKGVIKSLVETGKAGKAQRIILKAIEQQVGGTAVATANGSDKIRVVFSQVAETIGKRLVPVVDMVAGKLTTFIGQMSSGTGAGGRFRDSLEKIGRILSTVFGFIGAHGSTIFKIISVVTAAFVGWKTATLAVSVATKAMMAAQGVAKAATIGWTVATKAATIAQKLLNISMRANVIGLIVTALAALVIGFIYAYKHSEKFRNIVNGSINGVKRVVVAVVDWFKDSFIPFFTKKIPAAFHALIGWVKSNWPIILAIITGPVGLAVLAITKNWDKITGVFTKSKNWVSGTWKQGWNGAKNWIGDAVGKGRDLASGALDKTKSAFSTLKDWGGSTFKTGWSNMKYNLSHPIEMGKNLINTWVGPDGKLRGMMNGLDKWGQHTFGKNWAGMRAILTDPVNAAKTAFANLFGPSGKFRTILSGFIDAAKTIFARLHDAITHPIRTVIDAINIGLIKGGINWILKKLGVKDLVPWIPVPKGFSTGTANTGGHPSEIRGPVHGDEAVVPSRSRRRAEGALPGGLARLVRTGEWPVGPAAEQPDADQQARRGNSAPVNASDLPAGLREIARRGPKPGEPAGYGSPVGYGLSQLGMSGWYNRCLAFVNAAWNYTVGRFRLATARASMNAGPRSMSGRPPAGAGVYWDTGPAGHIALAAGDGSVFSNDIRIPGVISRVPQQEINKWGPYRGWWSPTGAKAGSGTFAPGGSAGGGLFDFLKGLSPFKWLANKASAVAGKTTGGGIFGQGLATLPAFIIGKAKDWISGLIGGGLINGTSFATAGIHALSEDGRPELVVGPQYRSLRGGSRVYNAKETKGILDQPRFEIKIDIHGNDIKDPDVLADKIMTRFGDQLTMAGLSMGTVG